MAAIRHPRPAFHPGLHLPVGNGAINGWVLAALAVFGFGALLPVLQNSAVTTRGFDVHKLEAQQAEISAEIRLIEKDIAALTSIDRIERRAGELGLGPADNPIYVDVAVPGPEPAKIPGEYLPGPVPSQARSVPLWRQFLSLVPLGR